MRRLIFLLSFVFTGCAISQPYSPSSNDTSFRSQLENHVWKITQIADYPEMMPKDYFTVQFKEGELIFDNVCGGFWGKYNFEGNDIIWLEMWDLSQNACTVLVQLPNGSTHEKISPANEIQAALKTYAGRYQLSLRDAYSINVTRHIASTPSLTLGKVSNKMDEK